MNARVRIGAGSLGLGWCTKAALQVGLLGLALGCGDTEATPSGEPLDDGRLELRDAESVLGFEAPGTWVADDGRELEFGGARVQGEGALGVRVGNEVALTSAPFEYTKTPNVLEIWMRAPEGATGQVGRPQAFIQCEERELLRQELEPRRASTVATAGGFARVEFVVPETVQTKLAGGCKRMVLGVVVDAGTAPGSYVLDGMSLRAQTPPIATVTTPLCGLPSTDALVASAVEMPEGHWDYQAWMASAVTQAELDGLEAALEPYPELTLGPVFDDVAKEVVVVVDASELTNDRIRADLQARDIALPLRIQPSCHPVAELRRVQSTFHQQTIGRDLPARVAYIDAALGQFVVEMNPGTAPSSAEVESKQRRLAGIDRLPIALDLVPLPKYASARARLEHEFGSLLRVQWGRLGRAGRLDDGERHFGGAGIGNLVLGNFCTSGFIVNSTLGMGSVTAGHCLFSTGQPVFSGTKFYGVIGADLFPAFDMMRIDPSGQRFTNRIHTDPCCPSTRTQMGKTNPAIGKLVCVTGMETGARCGIRVEAHGLELCDEDDVCTFRLSRAVRAGVIVMQEGDSGAPVYTASGTSGAIINGMAVGHQNDNFTMIFHLQRDIEILLGVTVALL